MNKVCAKCDQEKDLELFNNGLASYGKKRVCISCEEELLIYYNKQQNEAERNVLEIEQKDRLKELRLKNKQKYVEIVKELKIQIMFPKQNKNGEWQTASQIINNLDLKYPKGLIYKALSENALKGKSNGTARYYINYKEI